MWNGDLNRPKAKAISQMIMGMTDAQVNNNQHPSLGSGESTTVTRVPRWGGSVGGRVHGVWAMLWVREQPLFEGVELTQPCKQWSSEAIIIAPICI